MKKFTIINQRLIIEFEFDFKYLSLILFSQQTNGIFG